jgi:murein DD-endopeptidase MepM/ murein hydrolase activator NlpD
VEPKEIPLGGIAMARIRAARQAQVLRMQFRGREIPFHLDSSTQDYYALIGAGLECRPGPHLLTVEWHGSDGSDVTAHRINILNRRFPTEHLSVSPKMVEFPPEILSRVLEDQRTIREVCEKVSDQVYWERPFLRPVQSPVLSPFGRSRVFNGKPRSPHTGVDLRGLEGTAVMASNSGRAVLVRDCYLSGRTVVLDHGAGLHTLYAHLSSIKVEEGQAVERRQVIGFSGSSGRATGPHLHWGVSLLGERLDPAELSKLFRSSAGDIP